MSTWVAIASGPSLHHEDIEVVRTAGCKVAVINRTWQRARWADLLYAADARWWDSEYKPTEDQFHGERFTLSHSTARRHGISHVSGSLKWSNDPSRVMSGGLSGIQLINLLAHRASRIVLLGYDMQYGSDGRRHWHDDYDQSRGFANVPNLVAQLRYFDTIARECPVPIINATRETALTQFPRMSIREALTI